MVFPDIHMHRKSRILGIVLAGTVVLCGAALGLAQPETQQVTSPPTPPGKRYRIQLLRPEKVGQTSRVVVSGSQKLVTTTTPATEPPKCEKFAFEVKGIRRVLGTDRQGRTTKVAFTVDNCVKIEGQNKTEVVAQGTVVIASMAGGGKLDIRCKDPNVTLSDSGSGIVGKFIGMHMPTELDSEKVFGTDKPRRVGESWPIDRELVAKSFRDQNGKEGKLKKEDVTGQMKLAGVTKVDGIECLDLRAEMRFSGFLSMAEHWMTAEKSEISFTIASMLPVDPSVPELVETTEIAFTMVVKFNITGNERKVETTAVERTVTKSTPISK